jgi:FKBP-type peptidyl-prolyl cis-trans isomerase
MTLPARRRGPIAITLSAAAAAALLAGPLAAQQPSAPAAAAPASAPAAAAPAAKKAPAKKAGAPESDASAQSYSLGLMWGNQLRTTGVPSDGVNAARIAQGVHDGLTGKVALSDKDRQNIQALASAGGEANHKAAAKFLAENGKKPGVVTTASGLQYQELTAGKGDSPKARDSVVVNYRGTTLDGSEFDSSYKRGQPATFEVGQVIPGWTEALQLMKPGAKWRLFIPPQLAYDMRSPPGSGIPPGSMLVFDVELMSVKPAAAAIPPAPAVENKPAQPASK